MPGWFKSIREIVAYHPDIVILPKGHPATTESLLLLLTRARVRIGLNHPHHNMLLTHVIKHHWEDEHRSEAFARILEPFHIDPNVVPRRLHIGKNPEAETWADMMLKPVQNPVSINISASQPSRRWPLERWVILLDRLHGIYPTLTFIALGSPEDANKLFQLDERFSFVRAILTPSFLHASAVIARTELLISVDTGIIQAAAAREIPIVGLYNGDHEVYTRFAPQSVSPSGDSRPEKQ